MKQKTFYTELAYIIGLVCLAFGAAFASRADFGMSMVVAPAYILHLKISEALPFFSYGMAAYTVQAVIIAVMIIVLRRFKFSYIFSFVTAVLYGIVADGAIAFIALIPTGHVYVRIVLFICGTLFCAAGVSLMFHTYISPEAYDIFVKEFSEHFNIKLYKLKTIYDCTSCLVSIILSFLFFGLWQFRGVNFGTVICALCNGFLIGSFSKLFERHFVFKDGLHLRKYF